MKKFFTHWQLRIKIVGVLLFFTSTLHAQLSASITGVVQPCYNDGQATVNITGGTPPYTIQWSMAYSPYTVVSTSATATGLAPGGYHLWVSDATSAIVTDSVYLNPPFSPNFSTTGTSCPLLNGSATISITGGGTPPFDYLWSNGVNNTGVMATTNTISGLGVGQYDCIVMDAMGCGISTSDYGYSAHVTNLTPLTMTFTKTPSSCFDGTATVNPASGTAPFSYLWNTTPVQTTQTATNLAPGTYWVTITDINGCDGKGSVYVNPSGSYPVAWSTKTNNVCPATNSGAINLSVSGVGPFTYTWNTGAITQDISSLTSGNYTVAITDAAGCTIHHSAFIGTTSPVNVHVSTTNLVSCTPGTGTATVSATGGTPPYTFSWNTGSTTAGITGLNYGYYIAHATDANGCSNGDDGYVDYNASCYFNISGKVVNDQNGNCTEDPIDTRLPGQVISLSPGLYATTNTSGFYNTHSLTAGTYTLGYTPPIGWGIACPGSPYVITAVAGSSYSGNDFYTQPSSFINDLVSYVNCGQARPGFQQVNHITIRNTGTTTLSGTLQVEHDGILTFASATPAANSYNSTTHIITFDFLNLGPYQSRTFVVKNNVSNTTPLNTPVGLRSRIVPLTGEVDTLNNSDTCGVLVSGAFDPNVKEVSPRGIGLPGFITTDDEVLEYTIHFQNTGSDTALNIQVIDTLDTDLDITSFELIESSFPVVWNVSGPGIATFTFNEIHLPDSTANEQESHGFVSYRIRQKPDLTLGTEITNTAYIYFDFNPPIVTNTVLNTINNTLGVEQIKTDLGNLTVYPNPSSGIVYFNTDIPGAHALSVMDLTGRGAGFAQTNGNAYTFDGTGLENGVYLYLLQDAGRHLLQSGKFVIQH